MDFDRTRGIGGSDVPAILGVSPYATATDVWLEKTRHPSWRPKEVTPEMRFGTLLEPVMRAAYEQDTGWHVASQADKVFWADDNIRYAHIDGLVVTTGEGIWEGKAPFQTWRNWHDGPPAYVLAQVQHYMAITGEPWCDVTALAAGLDPIFQTYRVKADPPTQYDIQMAVLGFWHDNVLAGEPPEPLPPATLYPTNESKLMVVADDEDERMARALLDSKEEGTGLIKEQELIKDHLKSRIGTAAGMVGDGWRIRWAKNRDSTKTDWSQVGRVYGKLLDQIEAAGSMDEVRHLLETNPPSAILSLYTAESSGARPFVIERTDK